MNAVGLWVANLSGAYVRVPLFGVGPMLLAPTQPRSWRPPQPPLHSSAAASSIGRSAESPLLPPRLDVLIAGDGRGSAVRGNDGPFAIHHIGGNSFAVREWLAADADGRDVHDKSLGQGIVCDASGCIGKLADGAPVSYVLTPEAFEEDCARAALVVASRGEPTADCRATVIGRALWRHCGALTLRRNGSGHGGDFVVDSARSKNFDRPWSPAPAPREAFAATSGECGQAEIGTRARDATPRQEDIEADQ